MQSNNKTLTSFLFLTLATNSCKKLIEIPAPVGTITTSQVFTNDNQASAAASGMYFQMINSDQTFSNSAMSIYCGMSSDELIPLDQNYNDLYIQFQQNTLASTNTYISGNFWANMYSSEYKANAIIEGLSSYSGVHDSLKNELTGEAKFIRAFCNFYLVNLFGPIPLVTTINWRKTNLLSRTPVSDVYEQIIMDLKDAQSKLSPTYSAGNGQRIIPNKWCATALLARVYLYKGDWINAELQADTVIKNSSLYNLPKDLNSVFLTNSSEAIWQLQQSNSGITSSFNATPEGYLLIPFDSTYAPFAYLNNSLLNAFEPGDQRKASWINRISYNNLHYYIPYKYKMGPSQATVNGPYTEYYMVLRLAEQYLIRAEARAQQNNLDEAASDLNTIRNRAGLDNTSAISKQDLLSAIVHERQVELFTEWGHRWLDLKRTSLANTVLSPLKPLWSINAQMYPIPVIELETDPNLTQNAGY